MIDVKKSYKIFPIKLEITINDEKDLATLWRCLNVSNSDISNNKDANEDGIPDPIDGCNRIYDFWLEINRIGIKHCNWRS